MNCLLIVDVFARQRRTHTVGWTNVNFNDTSFISVLRRRNAGEGGVVSSKVGYMLRLHQKKCERNAFFVLCREICCFSNVKGSRNTTSP